MYTVKVYFVSGNVENLVFDNKKQFKLFEKCVSNKSHYDYNQTRFFCSHIAFYKVDKQIQISRS